MPRRQAPPRRTGRVLLRAPELDDEAAFLAAARASRALHGAWVRPPRTPAEFARYLRRVTGESRDPPTHVCRLVVAHGDGALLGVANLNNLLWGGLRTASLGYYGFVPHGGRGYVREGVALLLTHAFRTVGLHRAEAAIQPGNHASLALVAALGFRHEGESPRYLKLGGRWRDHTRWAITADEWRPGRVRRSAPRRVRPSGSGARGERILGA